MNIPPFRVILPRVRRSAAVFSSSHSGREYDIDFLKQSQLSVQDLRSLEDAYVDRLFDTAPTCGAPLICATAPRAYVDLNRQPDELDPKLIDGVHELQSTPRVHAGFGVVPRVASGGRNIYAKKLSKAEVDQRLARFYYPYHLKLRSLMRESHQKFGLAILFDCHSMPHASINDACFSGRRKPEIILGDRFGKSCAPSIIEQVQDVFTDAGFRVGRNSPYAGAYVAYKFGRPSANQHLIQIEIDRALYLNERTFRPNENFAEFRRTIASIIERLVEIGDREYSMAAE